MSFAKWQLFYLDLNVLNVLVLMFAGSMYSYVKPPYTCKPLRAYQENYG